MRCAFRDLTLAVVAFLPACSGQTVTVSAVLNEANPNGSLSPGCRAVVVASTNQIAVSVGGTAPEKNYVGWSSQMGEYVGIRIPVELPPGPTAISVSGGPMVSVALGEFAPSLYSLDGSGTGIGYFRRQPLSSFDPSIASVFDGSLAHELSLRGSGITPR